MVTVADTAHLIHKKHPNKHNHYGFRDFFQFNAETGNITDWNDSRNILTSEDFIIGLLEGLEEEVGEASTAIMYSIGIEWGKQDSLFFNKWFEREFKMSTREANLMFLLETWWWP
ncbi:MAG: 4-vinyl reductase, partial [Cyanobacteria bacterium J06659_2]